MPAATWVLIGAVLIVLGVAVGYIAVLRPLIASGKRLERIYPVLNGIAAQFSTDSGTSMRDLMNRLEDAAADNRTMNDRLMMAAEHARIAALASRAILEKLDIDIENAADVVEAAQKRADDHQEESPGSASDAAWRNPPNGQT